MPERLSVDRGNVTSTSAGYANAGRSDPLWTCRGCHRNNEARLDVCPHCKSHAPTGNTNHQRVNIAVNPYQRFVHTGSNKNPVCGVGSHKNRLSLPNSARGQGQSASRVNCMDRGLNAGCNEQRYQMRPCDSSSGASRTYPSCPAPPPRQRMPPRLVPIDPEAAKTWIYPVNYPVRKYQQQIVTAALFRNTLVALPTGLGKTLIAAVIMYNFYRWFPGGKVVFLAPTKPLVAQQISACYDIMGVPEKDTAELQGSIAPEKRRELWRERRVFFCTPQSMVNDIKQKRCNPGEFVCVVVDEAHRGTGNYAYVNVVREVAAATPYFRVLALSATPGSDTKAIQQVLENLRISHIECRGEDDPEVAKHTHARQIEVVRCKLGDHMDAIRQNLVSVLQPLVSRMADKRVLFTRDPMALKAWGVLEAVKTFRRTAIDRGITHMAGEVETEMAILTKVVQAKEVLLTHGAAGCFNKLANMEGEVRQRGFRSNAERGVMQHEAWGDLMKLLRQTAGNTAGVCTKHPKLIKLKEVLREHFGRYQAAGKSTRAIVFTQWRDSVEEITDFLADEHLLRVKAFIGQGNGSGGKARAAAEVEKMKAAFRRGGVGVGGEDGGVGSDGEDPLAAKPRLKGQTQKEQKAVVKAFFAGEFNCLVATCIGEEGLDIGEVDLIVSFDALSSPVRMVQRMGRTGRKRAGKVVVLVTEGAEEAKLRNSNSKSKSITKTLQTRKDKFEMFQGDDPMVPPGPRPRMMEQEMVIDEYHLSQVGGHQRKNPRKGGGSGGSGGASVPKDSWRLTEEQEATLAEAYSNEPGVGRYVPDPASGWKSQKTRWAAGTVARSARSRLICEIKDFVEHQEWELLYDPGDMQLILATSRREDEDASVGSGERRLKTNSIPSKYSGNARAGSSGESNEISPLAPISDSDEDFGMRPLRGYADLPGSPRWCDQGSGGREEGVNNGDGVAGQGDNGVRGGVSRDVERENEGCERGRENGMKEADGGTGEVGVDGTAVPRDESGCKSAGSSTAGVSLTGSMAMKRGSMKRRVYGEGARKVTPGVKKSAASRITGGKGRKLKVPSEEIVKEKGEIAGRAQPQTGGHDQIVNGCGGGDDDDNGEGEVQSGPVFRSSSPGKRGVAQSDRKAKNSDAVRRWRCGCGCLVKAGRSLCPLCGGAVGESSCDANHISSSSVSKSPTSVSVPSMSSKVRAAVEASGSSLKAFSCRSGGPNSSDDGGRSSPGDGSQAIRNVKDSSRSGIMAGNCGDGSDQIQDARWQCGCGCLMKADGKRCIMCGQPKPLGKGGIVDLSDDTESVTPRQALEGGVVCDSSCDIVGDTPASVGLWQCSGCGNEYVATRLKCRSCGISKPAAAASSTEERGTPDDRTTPARPSSRKDKDQPDSPGSNDTRSTVDVSSLELQHQKKIHAKGICDATVEVSVGEGELPSADSRVRDLTAARNCADGERARSPVISRMRENASSVGNRHKTDDCAGCPVVGDTSCKGVKSRSHPASETPLARECDLKDSQSPCSSRSIQSQDDGFGDLFPSLHRFGAGESATGASYTNRTRVFSRDPCPPSSSDDASVKIAESFDALPSPLVGPPPSLLVSPPPPVELFAGESSLRVGSVGNGEATKVGDLGLPSPRLSEGSPSHKAVPPGSRKASAPSCPRDGWASSMVNGGPIESESTAVIGDSDRPTHLNARPIVGTLDRGVSKTESLPLKGAQDALLEESFPSVAGVVMTSAKVAYCANGNAQACGHHSASATVLSCNGVAVEDEEEFVFEEAPQTPNRLSKRRSISGESECTRKGETQTAEAKDEPGRIGKKYAGLENSCNDDNFDYDDLACGVCGSVASDDEDPIILCESWQSCRTAVHADCYGVAEIPEGPWLCDPCSERKGKDEAEGKGGGYGSGFIEHHRCALCRHKGGALKLSRCGSWVHVVCVWWTPELSTEPDSVRPRSLSAIDPGRAELTCSGCHQQGGAVVPCAEPRCVESCHAFCAMRAGQVLEEENGVFKLYCKTHSRQQRLKKREEGKRFESASMGQKVEAEVIPGATTPAAKKESGTHGSTRETPPSFSTSPSNAARDEAGEGKEYGGGFLAEIEVLSQLPIPPRRRQQPRETGGRKAVLRTNRALLDLEDDDEEGDKKPDVDPSFLGKTSTGSARESEGTPRKIFDMAPPQQLPRPSPAKGFDENIASRTSMGLSNIMACSNNIKDNKRPSLSLPRSSSSRHLHYGGKVGSPSGGGGETELMTLSQAVSPVEDTRDFKRRRRLRKCKSPDSETEAGESKSDKRCLDEDASRLTEGLHKRQKKGIGGGDKRKGKRENCHYDKASYRRYIDHEAEVDEDLSDDDEGEILDDYDSDDSFVNDGPLSYETSCSSPGGDTPLRSRETPGDEVSGDGGARKGAKRRCGKAKIGCDRDEKGMYLQLLARTQSPVTNPYLRRRGDKSGSAGRRRTDRFAFINAVMAHARNGGDPLEIEEVCRSEGFTQDSYRSVGSPKPSPSQSFRSETPEKGWSPRDVMFSEGSDSIEVVGSSLSRQVSDRSCLDAQSMYSQALRQAHPGSPSSQQEDIRNVAKEPCEIGDGKGNVPCATVATVNELTGDDHEPRSMTGGYRDSAGDDSVPKSHADGVKGGFVADGAGGRKAVVPSSGLGSATLSSTMAPLSPPASGKGVTGQVGLGAKETGAACGGVGKGGSGGNNKSIGSTSLTDQQRKKMLENREKALARLRQRQQAAADSKGGGNLPGAGAIEAKPTVPVNENVSKMSSVDPDNRANPRPSLPRSGPEARQSSTQRERFQMTMDMDMESDDSDVENRDNNASAPPALSLSSSAPVAAGQRAIQAQYDAKTSTISCTGITTKTVIQAERSGCSSASLRLTSHDSSTAPTTSGKASPVVSPVAASITTIPLSAPRARALESLAAELRSREGFAVHASPLGGGSRDVDLAVGSQCAVCVRSRRQFIAQMQSSAGAPAVAGDGFTKPLLLTLLEAGLQRYTRVALIVEGEGDGKRRGGSLGIDQEKEEEAVGKVEALRGASVVVSCGWRETADKVVALVEREASAGAGLPLEVTGPLLNTAQEKFLTFLLRAPTLSYPGGLYLLQAFRGRSGKEMIASSAKEFQSAVPGMTARQAAILKRFLASGGASGGGAVIRPIATGASAVGEGPAARGYSGLSTSQRGRH